MNYAECTAMSAEASGYVWRYSPHKGPVLLVHLAIGDVANDDHGNEVWLRRSTIAKKCRCTPRTVTNAWRELELSGDLIPLESLPGRPRRFQFVFVPGRPPKYGTLERHSTPPGTDGPTPWNDIPDSNSKRTQPITQPESIGFDDLGEAIGFADDLRVVPVMDVNQTLRSIANQLRYPEG